MKDILLALVFLLAGLYGYYLMARLDRFILMNSKSIADKKEKRDDDR